VGDSAAEQGIGPGRVEFEGAVKGAHGLFGHPQLRIDIGDAGLCVGLVREGLREGLRFRRKMGLGASAQSESTGRVEFQRSGEMVDGIPVPAIMLGVGLVGIGRKRRRNRPCRQRCELHFVCGRRRCRKQAGHGQCETKYTHVEVPRRQI